MQKRNVRESARQTVATRSGKTIPLLLITIISSARVEMSFTRG